MSNISDKRAQDPTFQNLYDVNSSDPNSELVDRSDLSEEDTRQIGKLMKTLSRLREVEQTLSEASEKYMKLNKQDMRALHYLIVAANREQIVTPGMLASYLKVSAASTTKLLNRLEEGAHIVRRVHPADRRAFAIEVTSKTRASAMQTVGRRQASRFYAAARLSSEQRDVVINFLQDMAQGLSLENADWAEPDSGGR